MANIEKLNDDNERNYTADDCVPTTSPSSDN